STYSILTQLFFHNPSPTPTSPLSLHDALPISSTSRHGSSVASDAFTSSSRPPTTDVSHGDHGAEYPPSTTTAEPVVHLDASLARSEEHTSELQSPDHLVCRLLLEKKKKKLHTR